MTSIIDITVEDLGAACGALLEELGHPFHTTVIDRELDGRNTMRVREGDFTDCIDLDAEIGQTDSLFL